MTVMALVRQRWIPSLFVIGFLVVTAVNAVLILAASRTFSGLVVSHPYAKGMEYSENLTALKEQRKLDWRHQIVLEPTADGSLRLQVRWTDHDGRALTGLAVSASLERPVEAGSAIAVQLGDRGDGLYGASVSLPRAGLWDVHITAMRDGHRFAAADRIQVP